MINPAVKVKVLGDEKDQEEVKRSAQAILDSLFAIGWTGYITEVALIGQLLGQCGAVFDED